MKYNAIDNQLFIKNRAKLVKKLTTNSLAIINAADEMPKNGDQNYSPYRQNSDFFYLTGIEQEKSILTLCPNHPNPKLREILFLVKGEKDLETWYGHKFTEDEAKTISGVATIKWLSSWEGVLADLIINSEHVYINTNENLKYDSAVRNRDLRFVDELQKAFPLHHYKRLAPLITELRLVKETEEIDLMKKACTITDNIFKRLLSFVKPGVKEYEVEAEIYHEYIRNGCNSHSFYPIVASGANTCILHYPNNDQVCKDGDLLLIDFGVEYANYTSDCTRTIPVNGKFSPRQKDVYEAVLRVMKAATLLMITGKTINQLNPEVDALVTKELIALGLLKQEDVDKEDKSLERDRRLCFKYFMHGNSHFMGLDVHDVGTRDTIFVPGMVLSCEPGIYIPEESIGIRLETDILITADGPVDLLAALPVEVDDIENLMKS